MYNLDMMNDAQIDILLATYNGSQFITEQLESLHQQTYTDWRLIVSDDLSDDNTLDIVKNVACEYELDLTLLQPTSKRLGACANFSRLLQKSSASYFMFCDQDDFWLPCKIEKSLQHIKELEQVYGTDTPILVHTDLKVVNENLELSSSHTFWKFQNLNPQKASSLQRLLMQNQITGCTVIGNKALRDLVGEIPFGAIMHDWWLGLIATSFGVIDAMPEATVLYRQHYKNVLGAVDQSLKSIITEIKPPSFYREKVYKSVEQAKLFYDLYGDRLNGKNLMVLEKFIDLSNQSFIEKRMSIIKHGFYKTGLLRNLMLMIVL